MMIKRSMRIKTTIAMKLLPLIYPVAPRLSMYDCRNVQRRF